MRSFGRPSKVRKDVGREEVDGRRRHGAVVLERRHRRQSAEQVKQRVGRRQRSGGGCARRANGIWKQLRALEPREGRRVQQDAAVAAIGSYCGGGSGGGLEAAQAGVLQPEVGRERGSRALDAAQARLHRPGGVDVHGGAQRRQPRDAQVRRPVVENSGRYTVGVEHAA
jgi:hypothetical protein